MKQICSLNICCLSGKQDLSLIVIAAGAFLKSVLFGFEIVDFLKDLSVNHCEISCRIKVEDRIKPLKKIPSDIIRKNWRGHLIIRASKQTFFKSLWNGIKINLRKKLNFSKFLNFKFSCSNKPPTLAYTILKNTLTKTNFKRNLPLQTTNFEASCKNSFRLFWSMKVVDVIEAPFKFE